MASQRDDGPEQGWAGDGGVAGSTVHDSASVGCGWVEKIRMRTRRRAGNRRIYSFAKLRFSPNGGAPKGTGVDDPEA